MANEPKKLYRLEKGRILAGVCAGLGEYFDIDPTLIRLLWILVFFMGGSGLLIYIIFWIVLPVKKNGDEQESKKKMSEENINNDKTEKGTDSDYFFALFLIFVGFIFLLNTTGIIAWGIWTVLWRFWPLILIFIGLNLIMQDNRILRAIVGILSIFAFILVFFWSWGISSADHLSKNFNINVPVWVTDMGTAPEITKTLAIPSKEYADIEAKNIDVDIEIGDLRIVNEDSENILSLESEYFRNFGEPQVDREFKDQKLDVDIHLGSKTDIFLFNINKAPKYILNLGQSEIPTTLALKLGAGRTNVNLAKYNLETLHLELGAGKIEATISDIDLETLRMDIGAGQLILRIDDNTTFKNPIFANLGTGNIKVEIPENFGYRINGTLGVGSTQLREETFSGFGQEIKDFKSENYDLAEYILEFEIDTGVGKFTIQ